MADEVVVEPVPPVEPVAPLAVPAEPMKPVEEPEDPMMPEVRKIQALFDSKLAQAQAAASRDGHLPPIVVTLDEVKALHES